MKYLVIEDKHVNVNQALTIVRKYYPRVRYPHLKNHQPQFFFPKSQLTKECTYEIARKLGMNIIKMSNERAVIGY